ARQGADVNFISRVGQDTFGDMARSIFQAEGMREDFVSADPERPTGTASIVVDDASGENAIVIVPGACNNLTEADVDAASEAIAGSALFMSQLELPMAVCRHGIALARQHGVPVLVNPAPAMELPRDLYPDIDYITPNETEASALVGWPLTTMEQVASAASTLHRWGVKNVLITLGERGVFVSSPDFEGVIPALKVAKVVETTGAGDAFNGGLAAALAEGQTLANAARFGNVVAGLSVTRAGAAVSMPTRKEVEQALKEQPVETANFKQ
ncbi:MAG: PfkB family carbohydrate kinase, partial [Natronospirillum sp.]